MASGRNLEAEYAEQQEGDDQDDDPDAPADESEQPEEDVPRDEARMVKVEVKVVEDRPLVEDLLHLFPS
eukprot:3134186-Amphidinium_carterae.1